MNISAKDKKQIIRFFLILAAGALLTVVLELTLFNFRHYESLFFPEPSEVQMTMVGLTDLGNGHYKIAEEGDVYIEFTFPYQKIENIHVDIETEAPPVGNHTNTVWITLWATDEGNAFYYEMPERLIAHGIPATQYLRLHPAGNVDKIKLAFSEDSAGSNIIIHDISLNQVRPISVSKIRMVLIFLIYLIVIIYRPGSRLYQIVYDPSRHWQKVVMAIFAVAQIAVMIYLADEVNYSKDPNKSCYTALTESLTQGKVYLDREPDEKLKGLENPYDPSLRGAEQVEFLWDYAFYEGRYYVYFGLAPELVFYLPHYLITGNHFPVHMELKLCSALCVIGIMLLLHQFIKKFFKKTSFIIYMLLCAVIINGIGILYTVMHPDMYSIPKLLSITSVILGVYFWMSAIKIGSDTLIPWRLAVGSVFVALIAGSRPQMLLAGFIAFPLFGRLMILNPMKKGFNSKNILNLLCLVIPLLVLGGVFMWYNQARFGSVMDFGANYNLTSNDMTKRGFVLDRCGYGIFTFLFQLPVTVSQFPFLKETVADTSYLGTTIRDAMYGGLFAGNLVLFLGLLFHKFKDMLKERKLYSITAGSILFGLIIVIADTQMAGILVGYMGDFAIFFFVPMAIVVMSILEVLKSEKTSKNWLQLISGLCILSICYNYLVIFVNSNIGINSTLFQKISSAIQFWL